MKSRYKFKSRLLTDGKIKKLKTWLSKHSKKNLTSGLFSITKQLMIEWRLDFFLMVSLNELRIHHAPNHHVFPDMLLQFTIVRPILKLISLLFVIVIHRHSRIVGF